MPAPPRPPPPKNLRKKTQAPTEATPEKRLERARGALLGMCVGEALGIPNRGRNLSAPDHPTLCEGPLVYMRPGPGDRKMGVTSSGTQQAMALSKYLRREGTYSLRDATRAYREWFELAAEKPEVMGHVIAFLNDGRMPEFAGFRVWLEFHRPKDSSPIIRAIPLGVLYAKDREARTRAVMEDTRITHFAPECALASVAVTGLVAAALTTPEERLSDDAIAKVVEDELSYAALEFGKQHSDWISITSDAHQALRSDLKFARFENPQMYGPDLSMFSPAPTAARVAFRLALWEAFHAPSFNAGLLDVVNRGGAADANAAVAGAILGALYGESTIDAEWRERVLEAVGPLGGVWWNKYHPRILVKLANLEPGTSAPDDDF